MDAHGPRGVPMLRTIRNALVLLAGSLRLVVATAAPAFALGGYNHTEPLTHRH